MSCSWSSNSFFLFVVFSYLSFSSELIALAKSTAISAPQHMLFISSPIPYHFWNKCYFLMLFLSTVVMAPLQLLDSFCSVTSFEPRSGLYSLLQGYLLPSPGHKNQPTEPAAGFWQWWRMLVHWIKVVVAQPLSSTLHGHMVATNASKVSQGVCCGMGCTTLKAVS